MHPEIALEDDVKQLLREHEQLARLLLEDAEAGRCEMGTRLFEELESLRDLNEREELKTAKRALEESNAQKDLLMKEVHHRVKNSLQIVASLLSLQAKTAGPAASRFHDAAARVMAIATVHQQLHDSEGVGTVRIDRYLVDLCRGIEAASSLNRLSQIAVDATPLVISTDVAVPLAIIVNELVTNAIQHAKLVGEGGIVRVLLETSGNAFWISVSDAGDGPDAAQTHVGLGTRIVETLASQINAAVAKEQGASGYRVTVTVPNGGAAS